tara:strand:- start:19648 stop:19869 length:222 start_codon:yes stop_codon:yes gene_type:complete
MNQILYLFEEKIEDITKVYLSDGIWYRVTELEVFGHFGQKPQYFTLLTQGDVLMKKICGKASDIRLIEMEYNQ